MALLFHLTVLTNDVNLNQNEAETIRAHGSGIGFCSFSS